MKTIKRIGLELVVKYIAPTNTRESRVKVSYWNASEWISRTIPFDHRAGSATGTAAAWLECKGVEPIGVVEAGESLPDVILVPFGTDIEKLFGKGGAK